MNQKWDAKEYSDKFSFVHQYGNDVAGLIDPDEVCTVLDLGCGNGALTKYFADRGFSVIGMDASDEMLTIARKNYPDLTFVKGDAVDFSLEQPVDAVFSNAVFHWIDKENQPAMLKCVYQSLNPGGQFVFEMGGYCNNALIHEKLAEIFSERGYEYRMPFYFPSIGEYASMLEDAGFLVREAFLFDRPTPLKGENGLEDWMHMFLNRPFIGMPEAEKDAIIHEAACSLKGDLHKDNIWYSDYVRLRMKAIVP